METVLKEFEPIFGEPKLEFTGLCSGLSESSGLLFYVHSLDSCHLRIYVSDFRDINWHSVLSVSQLEDMRDCVGIGGSWSDFIDYVAASIKSEDVKLVLQTDPNSTDAKSAKLVAQKAKGMPRISFSLSKLTGSAAADAIANISMELFKAFKGLQHLFMQEQERNLQLTKMLSAEKEKNENIQSQLELNSKRQKLHKADISANVQNSPDKRAGQDSSPAKVTKRVPAYRRARARGVILQDGENDEDS